MIMKTNIIIGPKMGASPIDGNPNLKGGTITWGRSIFFTKFTRLAMARMPQRLALKSARGLKSRGYDNVRHLRYIWGRG